MHISSGKSHYCCSGKKWHDTVLICLSSDDVEEGWIQMNKVAHNNLWVKLGDLVNVHQCLNIQYGKRVHILLFDDSIEGLSWNIFDVYLKPYFLDSKSLIFGMKFCSIWLIVFSSISTRSQRWYLLSSRWHANGRVQGHGGPIPQSIVIRELRKLWQMFIYF